MPWRSSDLRKTGAVAELPLCSFVRLPMKLELSVVILAQTLNQSWGDSTGDAFSDRTLDESSDVYADFFVVGDPPFVSRP